MGLDELLAAVEMPVYVHRDELPMLQARKQLQPVEDGQTVTIGHLPVQLIHTPGHTPGSQCLLVDGRLLTGDTLFIKACGRWDLPGGDAATLYESLSGKLRPLDDATVVYPGHNYAEVSHITLGDEKKQNPFLSSPSREHFLRMIRSE